MNLSIKNIIIKLYNYIIALTIDSHNIRIDSGFLINAYDYKIYEKLNLDIIKVLEVPICDIEMEISLDFEQVLSKSRSICDSPHYDLLKLYEENGVEWIRDNYTSLRYYNFFIDMNAVGVKTNLFNVSEKISFHYSKMNIINKINNFISLYESIKNNGYLSGKYKGKYVSVLMEPLASTRFGQNKKYKYFGVFSGHHRLACLAILKNKNVKVLLIKDALLNEK
jgi:hypothetical protein